MRESIWSIPATARVSYFALFALLTISGACLYVWHALTRQPPHDNVEIAIDIISGISTIGVAAATIAITITEGARYIMVIAQWFEEKHLNPLREKRRKQARAEAFAEVRDWEQRRKEAQAKGESFEEPAPYAEQD